MGPETKFIDSEWDPIATAISGAPFATAKSRARAKAAIAAYHAILAEKGWVIVPKRPTAAMLAAGRKANALVPNSALGLVYVAPDGAWHAMIAAAETRAKEGERWESVVELANGGHPQRCLKD